jgi:hypothetical protein
MKKETKEMLKTILSNQELIMKSLKIETPVKKTEEKKETIQKPVVKKTVTSAAKAPVKKVVKKAAK